MKPPKNKRTPLTTMIAKVILTAREAFCEASCFCVTDKNTEITKGGVRRKKNLMKSAMRSVVYITRNTEKEMEASRPPR